MNFIGPGMLMKSWKVEVKEARRERTNDKNAALWAVAYPPLMGFMGEREEEAEKRVDA